jgi:hypothetical protein
LDERVIDAVRSPTLKERKRVKDGNDVCVSPEYVQGRLPDPLSDGDLPSDDLQEDEESVIETDFEERKVEPLHTPRRRKDPDTMTTGESLTKELISAELARNGIDKMEDWDPLVSVLSNESKKQLVKEIDNVDDIIPLPGALTPPLRKKGFDSNATDVSLFQMMNDVESVVRGSSQCMALSLDGKGEQAVKKLSKLVLLGTHVLSRLNAERLKLHFPKQLAMKALKRPEEPVLREAHKKVLREAAQESRDINAVSRSFFRSGGRSTKRGQSRSYNRAPARSGGSSFPQRTSFTRRSQASGWRKPTNAQSGITNKFRSAGSKAGQQ